MNQQNDTAAYRMITEVLQKNAGGIAIDMIAKEVSLSASLVRNTIRYFIDTYEIIDDVVHIKNHPLNAYLQRGFKPLGELPEAKSSYVHKIDASKNIKHELRQRGPVRIQSSIRQFAVEEGI